MNVAMVQTRTALAVMALLAGAVSFAVPPDPRLLSLVPPESEIVGGAVGPLQERHRGNFLIFTRANTLDLEDFFSLVGADASYEIHEVIFAASAGHGGASPEHSLLVSGHFDADRLYRSARSTSVTSDYRGVGVVVVHPFERERAFLHDDRLLVIIHSRLAIFGTPSSVQQEIDRYLSGTAADASIIQKLSQLRNENETWCLISSLLLDAEILQVLRNLDPSFGEIDKNSDTLLFGIRYGRQIEFEYVVIARPGPQAEPVSNPPAERMFNPADGSLSLTSSGMAPGNGPRRVVKISRVRYDKWLANLTPHGMPSTMGPARQCDDRPKLTGGMRNGWPRRRAGNPAPNAR